MKRGSTRRIPDMREPDVVPDAGPNVEGFEHFSFSYDRVSHVVYYRGEADDPSVLLLPELAGFAPGLRAFAERLAGAGFRVFVPWLYGPLGRRAPLRNAARLCITREFGRLRAGVSSPITTWFRALATHIGNHTGGTRIGAIGMCLSGAFAIPLIMEPTVAAAVVAQPSVPLSLLFAAFGLGSIGPQGRLNVSDDEIEAARARLNEGSARLLAVRCRADRICPRAKIERLIKEFPVGLEVREYGSEEERNALGKRPHATFTKEYRLAPEASPEHYARRAFDDLVIFLATHLRAADMGTKGS